MANIETITVGATTYNIGGSTMGSYVGMVIESTTLDTEAKVISQYGGTSWIQHSGYVLRGGTSDVVANSAVKTGGSDDAVVIRHRHQLSDDTFNFLTYKSSGGSRNMQYSTGTAQVSSTNYTGYSGTDTGNNKNIPNYKSVYIWERTA